MFVALQFLLERACCEQDPTCPSAEHTGEFPFASNLGIYGTPGYLSERLPKPRDPAAIKALFRCAATSTVEADPSLVNVQQSPPAAATCRVYSLILPLLRCQAFPDLLGQYQVAPEARPSQNSAVPRSKIARRRPSVVLISTPGSTTRFVLAAAAETPTAPRRRIVVSYRDGVKTGTNRRGNDVLGRPIVFILCIGRSGRVNVKIHRPKSGKVAHVVTSRTDCIF